MATRYYMAALAKLWSTISIADKATWGLIPNESELPNYNHFLRHNINRFKHADFSGTNPVPQIYHPSSAFPTNPSTAAADITWLNATPLSKALYVDYQVTAQNDGWLLTAHRWTPGDAQNRYPNLIWAQTCPPNGVYRVTLAPLPPGMMIIRCGSSSRTGQTELNFSWQLITILA